MAPLTTTLRSWGYRVLGYMDDFLVAPAPHGIKATMKNCRKASKSIDLLLDRLGVRRHPGKGTWNDGATRLEHLGVIVDSQTMTFEVTESKAARIRDMGAKLLKEVVIGRRYLSTKTLQRFCGCCVSLSLAMPWTRFYTRSLYDVLKYGKRNARGRAPESHQAIRDLRFWRKLARDDERRRAIQPIPVDAAIHTNATDVCFGSTINFLDLRAGQPGGYVDQDVWTWRERASAITLRELRAVRLTLERSLGDRLEAASAQYVLLHGDNSAVVHVLNSFVSASPAMMAEIRRLNLVLERRGIAVSSRWLPSEMSFYADALSRRLLRRDLQIVPRFRLSVAAGMKVPRDAFPFRPLGERPFINRRMVLAELEREWKADETLILCPPPDLIPAILRKLNQTQAPAILLVPDWSRQPWHAAALEMEDRWEW